MEQESQGERRAIGDSSGRTGLVVGRFSPPHLGHGYLLDTARAQCSALIVAVAGEGSIANQRRVRWMEALAPDATVLPLHGAPSGWGRLLPGVDLVFGESLGPALAELMGARYVPVERQSSLGPPSDTIEADPWQHWQCLLPLVRAEFAQRVAILGPESSGKSTLAEHLARHFETVQVSEYVRPYLDALGRTEGTLEDIPIIAEGQVAAEDTLAGRANRILICDTNLVSTALWSEVLFGTCPTSVVEEMVRRRYGLVLVMDPHVPYTPDPQRCQPDLEDRVEFFRRTVDLVRQTGCEPHILSGDWQERVETAIRTISSLPRPILR